MSIFEKASKLKVRFETSKGELTTEQLWDLPLTSANGISLDGIAITLDKKIKDTSTISFVNKEAKADEITRLKFDIVKRIIDVKLEEKEKADKARDRAEQRQKIMAAMAEQKDAAIKTAPMAELEKMLKALEE